MKRLLLLLVMPYSAHAEVMDKEPSVMAVASSTIIAIAAAYFCARRQPWGLLVVLPLAGVWFGGIIAETLDPLVGLTISLEAGPVYLALPWLAIVGLAGAVAVGLWRRRCKPNNSSKPTPLRGAA